MSVKMSLDVAQFDYLIHGIEQQIQEATRPAAFDAAEVIYKDVQANVAKIGRVTGNLRASIYRAFDDKASTATKARYNVSWNKKKAPHGHLIEFGHIQRYVTYIGKNGQWYTAVRPEKRGKKKPSRKASQATKDAYYVPLPGGPRQVPARPFIRPALSRLDDAERAARLRLMRAINGNA